MDDTTMYLDYVNSLGSLSFSPHSPELHDLVDYLNQTYELFDQKFGAVFDSEDDAVDDAVDKGSDKVWAVIHFDSLDIANHDIRYTIRMNHTKIPSTFQKFDPLEQGRDTQYMKYYWSGFLSLQRSINMYFVENNGTLDDLDSDLYYYEGCPFPTEDTEENEIYDHLDGVIGLYLVIATLLPLGRSAYHMSREDASGARSTFALMGLKPVTWLVSWAVVILTTLFFVALFLTCLLYGSLYENTSFGLTLLLLMLYLTNGALIAMALEPIVVRFPKCAIFLLPCTLVLLTLPSYIYYRDSWNENYGAKTATCLLAPSCFALANDIIVDYEKAGLGVDTENMYQRAFSFSTCLWMLSIDLVVYSVLAWYLDQVLTVRPGRGPRPFYFFLTPSYWMPSKFASDHSGRPDAPDHEKKHSNVLVEASRRSPSSTALAGLRGVSKVLDDGIISALDNIHVDLYEGEVAALLGRPRAGKSMLLKIMTGLVEPTKGHRWFASRARDVLAGESESIIGYCPEDDAVIPSLTVYDHVILAGVVKGVHPEAIEGRALHEIHAFDLWDERNTVAENLSSTNRRLLACACALIGDPLVVLLDEPTRGMGPRGHEVLCEALRKARGGKTVLFTTSDPDDAELLSDRIYVMNKGAMMAGGTSSFLKSRLGLGYRVECHIAQGTRPDLRGFAQVLLPIVPSALLESVAPDRERTASEAPPPNSYSAEGTGRADSLGPAIQIVIEDDSPAKDRSKNNKTPDPQQPAVTVRDSEGVPLGQGGVVSIRLQYQDGDKIRVLLEALEAHKADLNIQGWNVIMAPFRDVFSQLDAVADATAKSTPRRLRLPEFESRLSPFRQALSQIVVLASYRLRVFHRSRMDLIIKTVLPFMFVLVVLGILEVSVDTVGPSITLTAVSLYHHNVDVPYGQDSEPYAETTIEVLDQTLDHFHLESGNASVYIEDYLAATYYDHEHCRYGAYYFGDNTSQVYSWNPTGMFCAAMTGWSSGECKAFVEDSIGYSPPRYRYIPVFIYHNMSSHHAWPAYLGEEMQASYRESKGHLGARLETSVHALPLVDEEEDSNRDISRFGAIFLAFVFTLMPASYTTFVVHEGQWGCKLRQFLQRSGVPSGAYWLAAMLADLLIFVATSELVVALLDIFDWDEYTGKSERTGIMILLLFLYPLSALPYAYALAVCCKNAISSQISAALHGLLLGFFPLVVFQILRDLAGDGTDGAADSLSYVARILSPHFILGETLVDISKYYYDKELDGQDYDINDWDVTSRSLVLLTLHALAAFPLLLFMTWRQLVSDGDMPPVPRRFNRRSSKTHKQPLRQPTDHDVDMDDPEDVANERERALMIDSISMEGVVLLKDVSKVFRGNHGGAVLDVTVALGKGERFGVCGPEGSGKSTLLGLVAGVTPPTIGSITVKGLAAVNAGRFVGWCPDVDPVLPHLTGREMLHMVAMLIRPSVDSKDVQAAINPILDSFNLNSCADSQIAKYTVAQRRCLSIAMALLGNPRIVALDEPTRGVDLATRRCIWDVIQALPRAATVLVSSTSLHECERLCSRLAVMGQGRMRCIGTIHTLRSRFYDGYRLEIEAVNVDAVQQIVARDLPFVSLEKKTNRLLVFSFPKAINIIDVYKTLELMKNRSSGVPGRDGLGTGPITIQRFSVGLPSLSDALTSFLAKVEVCERRHSASSLQYPSSTKVL
eukprot:TRINITY_DN2890_c0_g1::TRINITY_DN2890_c0_g1_i1::g.5809::m.5809 TRINITY_DN2890_c0_g1::TRINITY_DN2890_c0_g1_i1::g.5809  ORF type:complete len:1933 (-),score=440.83,sp/Q86UK0/ABCAC_HUMAN/23.33/4e-83,ABC_tran/PF00005.22/1.5e-18,ABC_tran/PF00005.22/1.9e-16,ABC2_membrane_3/PF12698.2/8.2e-11,ABC2_membrane_3/PF12698.2/3e-20,AAA_21/PF13304.1/1.3e+02,AAA_21/PF13304.1/2.6e+02,AAA_21/PF13304.1/0.24,AAA_25/PF13481.1/0.33,AAA_25/PF13481.1/30,AAA_29/PF13555.1/73,AAA_29/PF13555.1/0.33,MRAP/PF15183.1/36,MRAP/PF15